MNVAAIPEAIRSDEPASQKRSMMAKVSSPTGLTITACFVLLVTFLKALRTSYPFILGDEYGYEQHAHYWRAAGFVPTLPNVLFFRVFHLAFFFGDNFLVVTKLLNSVFFAAAFLCLYAIANKFLSPAVAWLFSLIVVLSPVSIYATYLMPESMYFLAFCLLTCAVVIAVPRGLVWGATLAGCCLAVLSSIKPHGLVLLPVVAVTIAFCHYLRPQPRRLWELLTAGLALTIAFLSTRGVINLLTVGNLRIQWFGTAYKSQLSSTVARAPLISGNLLLSLLGHIGFVWLVLGPAILITFWPGKPAATSRSDAPVADCRLKLLSLFSILTLGALLTMTAKYTADIAGNSADQLANRLHGRYYDFVLPLLALTALAKLAMYYSPFVAGGTEQSDRNRRASTDYLFRALMLITTALGAVFAYRYAASFVPSYADFPDLTWIVFDPVYLRAVLGCIVALGISFLFFPLRRAALAYFIVLAGFCMVGSSVVFTSQARDMATVPDSDRAAFVARNIVPAEHLNQGLVISKGTDGRHYRALFELRSKTPYRMVPSEQITAADVPAGTMWLLLLDRYRIELPYYSEIVGPGYQLVQLVPMVRIGGGDSVDLRRRYSLADDPGIELEGFQRREPWGAWTEAASARVGLTEPVHGHLKVSLTMCAFPPSAGIPLTFTMGERRRTFRLGKDPQVVVFEVDLTKPVAWIEFSGMQPASPKDLGLSADGRRLGIGVFGIMIEER